ncbi:ADP-ribosylglycohydrolase family protein [Spiroplasma cantharicola]|uniref:ADP-ribosylglycohydrolase n=1 Tax=Spiroplasma cantharicola TaxID=362837 RepID=A0A0M4JSI1_9MOLU|nr:ADP-ribosylglycohydrolase family protein [Spiroplasma cantharicola]ALD66522.1 ADP-ribosylglycohydrolase [Spiroplasma cantharicola]
MKSKIEGVIYGMAIGDAMGMPSELWGRKKVREFFKGYITEFLDGPQENEIAKNYKKGQFTDDTAQALVILDSLFENNFIPDKKIIAKNLLNWAEQNNAFKKNILGPTSKESLKMIKKNLNPIEITNKALSNGSAMRIAPIGLLFKANQHKDLVDYVFKVSQVTHTSDITISGASIIAMCVNSALYKSDFNEILEDLYVVDKLALDLGSETYSPSMTKRIKLAIDIANRFKGKDIEFINELYDIIGAGVNISESVPTAIAIAYYAKDVNKAAFLAANLAGDTDTIGAMACAICGAYTGVEKIDNNFVKIIKESNEINLNFYIEKIERYWKQKDISKWKL